MTRTYMLTAVALGVLGWASRASRSIIRPPTRSRRAGPATPSSRGGS